jgi:hypothetical protein
MEECVKELLKKIELLVERESSPPKQEDFANKGDYYFAKTLYKRFPRSLNEPAENIKLSDENLKNLWAWANGEKGIGILKPGYKFLSFEEAMETYEKLYKNTPVSWLSDLIPIFIAPNDYFICLKTSNKGIFSVNLTVGKIYFMSGTLNSYLSFIYHCIESGGSGNKYEELDPESYTLKEIEAAKMAGLKEYYPLTKNSTTVLHDILG